MYGETMIKNMENIRVGEKIYNKEFLDGLEIIKIDKVSLIARKKDYAKWLTKTQVKNQWTLDQKEAVGSKIKELELDIEIIDNLYQFDEGIS